MVSPVRVTAPSQYPGASAPVVIFECPHASNCFPIGYPAPSDLAKREDHEIWDPGAAAILHYLQQRFPSAWFIESRTSRLLADHNREAGYCFPEGVYGVEERQRILKEIHRPYINAVYGVINETLANRRFPILFNVHTFNPVLDGKERKLFSVGGDPDSVIVQTFYEHLRAQLEKPAIMEKLEALGVSPDRFLHAINEPFDFAAPKIRKENMATRYALQDGHPWVHLEVMNTFADLPVVQQLVAATYDGVLYDAEVNADWEKRGERHFAAMPPEQILRPVAPGPLHQPAAALVM